MIINVTQKHIDDATKWAKENPIGGNVCCNCIAARAISDALDNLVFVGFRKVQDRFGTEIGYSEELPIVTQLQRYEWVDTKPFSFELEMIDAR